MKKSDFQGPDCDDSIECSDLCEQMFPRDTRSKCNNLPEDMVETLFESYRHLQNIREDSLNDVVDPSALATLINIDNEVILNLVRDEWGVRDMESFLNWSASSPVVIQVLDDEDDNFEIFNRILLELSEEKFSNRDIIVGLSSDLGQYAWTFLYTAYENDNETAVEYLFDFLNVYCPAPKKNCKLRMLCLREEIDRRSNSYSSAPICPRVSHTGFYRDKYCYLQGPGVWSYINNLVEEKELKDVDVIAVSPLDEDYCKDFCKGSAKHCDRDEF